jgi:hypothetical protein
LFSFINIIIAVIAAYFLFRKEPRDAVVSRGPLFMVCFLLFFSVGIGNLPLALPGVFERALGHSVWANYMPPVKMNVTQKGGTWCLVRWREPIQTGYFLCVPSWNGLGGTQHCAESSTEIKPVLYLRRHPLDVGVPCLFIRVFPLLLLS